MYNLYSNKEFITFVVKKSILKSFGIIMIWIYMI